MSDGKVFGKSEQELTSEERLSLLEGKIPVYQDRIASYDKLFESFKDVLSQVSGLSSEVKDLKVSLDTLGKNVSNLHNSHVERINKLQSDLVEQRSLYEKGSEASSYVSKMIEQKSIHFLDALKSLKQELQDALLSTASQKQVYSLEDQVAQKTGALSVQLSDHKSFVKSTLQDINNEIEKIKSSFATRDALGETLNFLSTKVAALEGKAASQKDEMPARIAQIVAQCDQKIAAMVSEITSKPSELSDFKADTAKKLEVMSLDASSANIRSQNMDQKVFLLQKKFENLEQLVKKIELKS